MPRLGSSRVAMVGAANVMVNRDTGSPEGTFGSLVAGQPLYSGRVDWAWDATVAWQDAIIRRYVNAELSQYVDPTTKKAVDFQYRARTYTTSYAVTRSFGWDVNHDFSLGASINRAVYETNFPGADPQTVSDFVSANVPMSDTRVGPSLQYHSYRMRFLRAVDFDTLALQEDYRLGHDVILRVYPSLRAFGASRDILGVFGAVQYTWAVRDGLFRLAVQSTTEPQLSSRPVLAPSTGVGNHISDATLQPTAHLVSPTVAGIGRIALDANLIWRYRNYSNQTNFLGGDDRLRGFPTNFFVGQNVMSYNVEARTRPVEIATAQFSAVAFYDIGEAFSDFARFVPYQSLGVGLRALVPWLDRTVFRADVGFPLERPVDPSTGAPIARMPFRKRSRRRPSPRSLFCPPDRGPILPDIRASAPSVRAKGDPLILDGHAYAAVRHHRHALPRRRGARIAASIRAIQAQDWPHDLLEILVADGRSLTLRARSFLRLAEDDPRIVLVDNPAQVEAAGLNECIRKARGQVVVRMDVHADYATDFVRQCVLTLEKTGADNVGGAVRAKAESFFQRCVAAALRSPSGWARAPGAGRTRTRGHVELWPGARREVFETIGLFDPHAVAQEEAELNCRLQNAGGTVFQSPDIVVHRETRGTMRSLAKQYYKRGKGRARTLLKHGPRSSWRPAVPFLWLVSEAALLVTSPWHPLGAWSLGAYALATGGGSDTHRPSGGHGRRTGGVGDFSGAPRGPRRRLRGVGLREIRVEA